MKTLKPSEASEKKPMADSYVRVNSITACTMAGKDKSREGSGGKPSEMVERERKTVV